MCENTGVKIKKIFYPGLSREPAPSSRQPCPQPQRSAGPPHGGKGQKEQVQKLHAFPGPYNFALKINSKFKSAAPPPCWCLPGAVTSTQGWWWTTKRKMWTRGTTFTSRSGKGLGKNSSRKKESSIINMWAIQVFNGVRKKGVLT